ncbi:MAG: DUF4831 family protein [Salinivirgaceae bacterium]|nr:DUF4831 family protein [Salinivirgaceae bacterium]
MNRLKSAITIVTLTSATMAFGQKDVENSYFVTPVQGEINVDGHQVFYSLPANSLIVSQKIEKTVKAKGPYSQYAEKYLNITSGVTVESTVTYSIENVKVDRISRPDTSQLYAINFTGIDNLPMVQLNTDGTILACNCQRPIEGYKPAKQQNNTAEPDVKPITFLDMGVKPFILEEEDDDNDEEDSVAVKKNKSPQLIVATEEENAAAAAAFIRKIRKRRLKLVAGMAEETNPVDGKALKLMIAELDRLENEYLSLFVGKSVKSTYTQSFVVTPNGKAEDEQISMGYFSKTGKRNDAVPITMRITTLTNSPKVSIKEVETSSKSTSNIKYGLYYRIPATVSVSIDCGGQQFFGGLFSIAQKGVVVPMPSEYLTNQKYSIEFEPETGALKRITGN